MGKKNVRGCREGCPGIKEMNMNRAYKEIMSPNGLTELKFLVEKWKSLSENFSDKPSG
jgi:hypothetical protein